MKNYSVTTPDVLRRICIKNDWFTCGSNRQYDKMFYMNENGASIEEIATVIWLCSDEEKHCRRDILSELRDARGRYEICHVLAF